MTKHRLETPIGSTGNAYLDGMAALLVRHKLITGGPHSYTLMCSGGHDLGAFCGAGLAGQSPRQIVDLMAAHGWGIVPGVMGSAPKIVCREHSK